ncbi:thiamine pyrophosphate-binding protein [Tropicibacter naphthalenivorans]|uniref:Acetolactate synthase isozyme 2 large subunit n=1 Tax=Tropicibacter naphthalenivorans TaxID=441103 RepID=A0A0P1GFS9_9RHOB|nr:thiamine pyrophosphate-binding protein [Tropicibacter naphthalenivorans]CUH80688.1 Acetolactate synthase isozyme 2 large subunit [Tropicibacter naphthalenivorans]SMC89363.1 Thiamine pyrophosphate enzyme, N-terminal TPP binding domain [Tropicibacter naphthalenivorans]
MRDTAPSPKLHQQLVQALIAQGTSHLYGLVGDANLFMVDAYIGTGAGRYVPCTHEANAVLAAIGFAQATGQTGVATITHGPALTNVVTALAEAARGGIPLVLLCGDTAPGDLFAEAAGMLA